MSNGSRSTFSSVHSSTTTNRCPSTQVTLKPPPKPPNPLLTPPAVPLGNADSGTTGHYFTLRDSAHLIDVRPTSAPVSIALPAGEIEEDGRVARVGKLTDGPKRTSKLREQIDMPGVACARTWRDGGGQVGAV